MADFNKENKVEDFLGGVGLEEQNNNNKSIDEVNNNVQTEEKVEEQVVQEEQDGTVFKKVEVSALPAKQSIWSKIKSLLAEKRNLNSLFNIQLTPYQQKIENEINEFLHQEISFERVINFFKKSATLFKKSTIIMKKIVRVNTQEKETSFSQEQNGDGS